MADGRRLSGKRSVIGIDDDGYPESFFRLKDPPENIYVVGDVGALMEGLSVVGARLATPYGLGCAAKFAKIAANAGITIVSGGARGCDSAAHKAALEAGTPTVVFMGGGCNEIYPPENFALFQRIIDAGGAIVSENEWDEPPLGYHFRARNRLIASLSKATLIVEAGLPSGTFSTADEALSAGREVLVVPGSITSRYSRGANKLIYQGATPIIDEETFKDQLCSIFGVLDMVASPVKKGAPARGRSVETAVADAVLAQSCTIDSLMKVVDEKRKANDNMSWLLKLLSKMQREGKIARYPDGTYGPAV